MRVLQVFEGFLVAKEIENVKELTAERYNYSIKWWY